MKSILLTLILFLQITITLTAQSLESRINEIATEFDLMGSAVVVFCDSDSLHYYFTGKSDLARNIDIAQNTKFRIASISKSVTAIAIMQLVEQNLLDLDSDIGNILEYSIRNPNYPNQSITTRMLLSHKSSIVDGSTYNNFLTATYNNYPIPNLSQLLTPSGAYYNTSQFINRAPGSYFNYANINFVILGTIIEKLSNQRFDTYCREHIFQPLGIDASFNVNDIANIDSIAVLYRKTNNTWEPQADNYQGVQPVFTNLTGYIPGTNGARFSPQGGLRISAIDLAKIFRILANLNSSPVAILNQSSINLMLSDQWTFNGTNGNYYGGLFLSWGLGIHRITSTAGYDVVLPGSSSMQGHTGEAYGLISDAFFDTIRRVGLVFITNGCGKGYTIGPTSAFYTVEEQIFNAIETYGNIDNCLTVNIKPLEKDESGFSIYPNPAENILELSISNPANPSLLKIFTIDGRLLQENRLSTKNSTLDISTLNKGIYLLKIDNSVKQLIKQ